MITTDRLVIRPPVEADRARFVELFSDDDFMVFSAGLQPPGQAHARFDRMLALADELPFAKQPVIERSTGATIGYTGVARFDFEGHERLEYGYRLVTEARGKGYATEAGSAVLDLAAQTFHGEILAMIDPRNVASRRVIAKLGFRFWKQTVVGGFLDDLFRRSVG